MTIETRLRSSGLTGGAGGSGNVVGPAASTDNAIARYDGTTGKLIQDSGVILSDSNSITGVVNLIASNNVIVDSPTDASNSIDRGANTFYSAYYEFLTAGTTKFVIGLLNFSHPSSDAFLTITDGNLNTMIDIEDKGTTSEVTINGKLIVNGFSSSTIGQVIRAAASQSVNLTEWQNSSLTALTVIDKAGFIGVGTPTPAHKIHVAGGKFYLAGTGITTGITTDNYLIFERTDGRLQIGYFGSADLIQDTSGRIGLGMVPVYLLDVNGTINSATGNVNLARNLTDLSNRRNWGWKTEVATAGDCALLVSTTNTGQPATQIITFGLNGDVLINGFTSSTVGLTVRGATSQLANLQEWQNSSGTALTMISSSGQVLIGLSSSVFQFDIQKSSTGVAGFRVGNSNSGVSAQVQNRLENDGGYLAYYGITSTGFSAGIAIDGGRAYWMSYLCPAVFGCQSAQPIIFIESLAEIARFDTSGNFGIGTASPGAKLDVSGTGNFSGDVTVPDEAYGSGWNGSLEVPTKNAIYDKIETIASDVLFDHFADVGNVGTGEDDLYSDTIAAGQLSVNGQKLTANFAGIFVSSATATRRLRAYFGGTLIYDSSALSLSTSADWDMTILIQRESSSVVRCSVKVNTTTASSAPYTTYTRITGLTLSGTNVLKITGEAAGVGAATDDIVAKLGYIEFKPAA